MDTARMCSRRVTRSCVPGARRQNVTTEVGGGEAEGSPGPHVLAVAGCSRWRFRKPASLQDGRCLSYTGREKIWENGETVSGNYFYYIYLVCAHVVQTQAFCCRSEDNLQGSNSDQRA